MNSGHGRRGVRGRGRTGRERAGLRPTGSTSEDRAPRVVAGAMAHGCFGYPSGEMPGSPAAFAAGGKVVLPSSFHQGQQCQHTVYPCLCFCSPLSLGDIFTQNADGQREAKVGHLEMPMGLWTSHGAGP